jgi:hypothetical protein
MAVEVIASGTTQRNLRAFDIELLDGLATATVASIGCVATVAGRVVLRVVEFTTVVATEFPFKTITDEPSNPEPVS